MKTESADCCVLIVDNDVHSRRLVADFLEDTDCTAKRTLAILNARGTAHDLSVHELEIIATGARVK